MVSGEAPIPGSHTALFLLYTQGAPQGLLHKGANSIHDSSPVEFNLAPKAPSPNTIPQGSRFQFVNFEGTQSGHSRLPGGTRKETGKRTGTSQLGCVHYFQSLWSKPFESVVLKPECISESPGRSVKAVGFRFPRSKVRPEILSFLSSQCRCCWPGPPTEVSVYPHLLSGPGLSMAQGLLAL